MIIKKSSCGRLRTTQDPMGYYLRLLVGKRDFRLFSDKDVSVVDKLFGAVMGVVGDSGGEALSVQKKENANLRRTAKRRDKEIAKLITKVALRDEDLRALVKKSRLTSEAKRLTILLKNSQAQFKKTQTALEESQEETRHLTLRLNGLVMKVGMQNRELDVVKHGHKCTR